MLEVAGCARAQAVHRAVSSSPPPSAPPPTDLCSENIMGSTANTAIAYDVNGESNQRFSACLSVGQFKRYTGRVHFHMHACPTTLPSTHLYSPSARQQQSVWRCRQH